MRNTLKYFFIGALALEISTVAFAATPTIRVQGRLTDNGGAPIVGQHNLIKMALFTTPSGGSSVAQGIGNGTDPSIIDVPTNDAGLFSYDVAFNVDNVFDTNPVLYVEMSVLSAGDYRALLPRQKLSTMPYAMRAQTSAISNSTLSVGDNSVGSNQIIDQSIQSTDIGTGAIQAVNLASASVNAVAIASAAVTDDKIAAVSSSKITGQILDAQILSLDAVKITGTLATNQIGDAQVTDVKIATVAASKIRGPLALDVINALSHLEFANFETLKILQIQKYETTGQFSTSSQSFIDTQLKGTFTPKIATSKVLLFASGNFSTGSSNFGYATLARDGKNLAPTNGGFAIAIPNNNYTLTMVAYDSPGKAAPVVYSAQIRTNVGGSLFFPIGDGGLYSSTAVLIAIEIAQ